jgi:predicted ATP-grasp superfamily ATP-dependent carboligase
MNLGVVPQHPPSPVPVVVVEGTLNALGVVRSLAHGHMPIYLLETTARCAAGWSRHCHYVPVPSLQGRALADALVDLGRRLASRPVLILTGDHSVNSVSEHRQLIEPWFRISLPPHQTVRTLADKCSFHALAVREGFPVPRSVSLASVDDLPLLAELASPLVIKPSDKALVLDGSVERAVWAATPAEARRAATQMLARASHIIVQEWVEGPDSAIYFTLFTCDGGGQPVAVFVGRKLVCSPPAIGSTAVCVAAPEVSSELIGVTLEFIARLGYRGLGSLEFKRDARTGRFLIIEPTVGRTDWQEEIATLCGVNLPLLTYRAELGQPRPRAGDPSASVAWRQSAGFGAELTPGTRIVDGFFRWSDLLPALYYYLFEGILVRVWNRLCAACGVARSSAGKASKA